MINMKIALTVSALVASSLVVGGCANEATDERPEDVELAPPAEPAGSTEGLEIETSTPDRVEGRLARDGASIRFELTRDRASGARHVLLTRLSGEPLFESTLRDGIDRSTYLDGKVTTVGAMGEQPKQEGDAAAFDELSAMPEAKVVTQLKTALRGGGVDEELFQVSPPTATSAPGALAPKVYGAGGNSPYPDNTWRILQGNSSISFYSWGFWATTAIVIAPFDNSGAAQFRVGPTGYEYHHVTGTTYFYRQWWGAYVVLTNTEVPLCGVTYPWGCSEARLWVLVK
jgi:hypothetical protein